MERAAATTIREYEAEQVRLANATGRPPVMFIHGLWLLPSSWDLWAKLFDEAGYVPLVPGWPDDPETVDEARAHPELFMNKSIKDVVDHFDYLLQMLHMRPALIGHSLGGLIAQILAGRGLAAVTVAIDPAPFRGVLPLPYSALKSGFPVIGHPANRERAVPLTYEQFHYAFANRLSDDEAVRLYDEFIVPASAKPVFQAAAANLNPWTEDKVDTENPARGPLLFISGDSDHTAPPSIAHASYNQQKDNKGVTEFVSVHDRGHSLTIDGGWEKVADVALGFVKRYLKAQQIGLSPAG